MITPGMTVDLLPFRLTKNESEKAQDHVLRCTGSTTNDALGDGNFVDVGKVNEVQKRSLVDEENHKHHSFQSSFVAELSVSDDDSSDDVRLALLREIDFREGGSCHLPMADIVNTNEPWVYECSAVKCDVAGQFHNTKDFQYSEQDQLEPLYSFRGHSLRRVSIQCSSTHCITEPTMEGYSLGSITAGTLDDLKAFKRGSRPQPGEEEEDDDWTAVFWDLKSAANVVRLNEVEEMGFYTDSKTCLGYDFTKNLTENSITALVSGNSIHQGLKRADIEVREKLKEKKGND